MPQRFEVRHRFTAAVVASGEAESLKELVQSAAISGRSFQSVDLAGADLSGLDLSGTDFSDADFRGAALSRTNFTAADLAEADLSEADASETCFSRARLRHARLVRTHVLGANFDRADLAGVDFRLTDTSTALNVFQCPGCGEFQTSDFERCRSCGLRIAAVPRAPTANSVTRRRLSGLWSFFRQFHPVLITALASILGLAAIIMLLAKLLGGLSASW